MKLFKSPPGAVATVNREFDEAFDRFFSPTWPFANLGFDPMARALEGKWFPAIDLSETDKEYVVRIEVPGVPRENLDVHLEDEILTLSGHREMKARETGETYLWEEREAGKFIRTVRLPKAVQADKVAAVYQDGILTVRLPKADTVVRSKILIKE